MMISERAADWLRGAYDLHIHSGPDVVPRAQDMFEVAAEADRAGMAGLVFKDHTGSTAQGAHVVNRLHPEGVRSYGSLCLNPPVGGLNPHAVAAALAEGAKIIFFPTKAAAFEIGLKGPVSFPLIHPLPNPGYRGIGVLDSGGRLLPEARTILALIAEHDAVLATGHLSPIETLALLRESRQAGVRRMMVTHASEPVPGLTIAEQKEAVALGAVIEHCLLAVVLGQPVSLLVEQIHAVGAAHCVVSSDFGQAANGPVVAAFAAHLEQVVDAGVSVAELRTMIVDVPQRLLAI